MYCGMWTTYLIKLATQICTALYFRNLHPSRSRRLIPASLSMEPATPWDCSPATVGGALAKAYRASPDDLLTRNLALGRPFRNLLILW
jgi:hypothetical protein